MSSLNEDTVSGIYKIVGLALVHYKKIIESGVSVDDVSELIPTKEEIEHCLNNAPVLHSFALATTFMILKYFENKFGVINEKNLFSDN